MKQKMRALIFSLALLLLFALIFTACNGGQNETEAGTEENYETDSETEGVSSSETESLLNTEEASDTDVASETESYSESEETAADTDETETEAKTETEEETEMITDVITGETINAEYAANFTVSRVFSDDMVVQRGEHIRVWGFANATENGKKVSGEFKGMFAEALIENGEWCLTFGARLEADTAPAEMRIYTDTKEVVFKGVLVGDVYMVVGQSNAEASVSTHIANTDAATQGGGRDAIDPNSIIRLNRTSSSSGGSFPKKGTDYIYKDLLNTKQWTKTTEADTLNFSAVGYYFAKEMVEKTDGKIPVGVIEIGFSGAPLGSFLPNEVAEKYNTDTLSAVTGKYVTTGVNSSTYEGRGIYNCHLAPFEKYAIAGLIWYQGESNNAIEEAQKYNEAFVALMTYMRGTHNLINKDFPVFIVEFPSIYKKPADYSGSATWHFMELGIIRSYMGLIPSILENSYISVSNDLWTDKSFPNSLHPNCKFEQAGRLADLADVIVCGNGTLEEATGPIFKNISLSEDKKTVTITFTNVGDGLKTLDGGVAVKGIVGIADKYFGHSTVTPISANITSKDQITVIFDIEVKAVAYNYLSEDLYGETINLCNGYGCPASAFITPYTERNLGSFAASDFMDITAKALDLKGKSFDTLTADGENLFSIGGIESKLSAAGNKVEIYEGTGRLSSYGWIGFKYEILMLGYSIDGGNAVFNTYPSMPQEAVVNAGGQYAKRFTINIDVSKLTVGNHTVTLLALVDLEEGVAVRILSFDVSVIKAPAPSVAPDGLDLPAYNADGYGFIKTSFDIISVDGKELYRSNVATKIQAADSKISVNQGTKSIRFQGWIGFETSIDKFGYALDGADPIIETSPSSAESAVLAAGGQFAKRYDVSIDVSALDAGLHTCDLLVRINTDDGNVVLNLISFTVSVE